MSEPLRVGLIGVGRWGRNLASSAIGTPGMSLVAVCDTDPRALCEVAMGLPNQCTLHGDARGLLANPDVQAVLVATPAESHAWLTLAALDTGRPVFVEKPLCDSVDSARAVERAAAGRVMVGHLLVFHPAVARLASRIAAGSFGRPLRMEVTRTSLARHGAPCPWWNLGVHDLALALRWFGAPTRLQVIPGDVVRAIVEFREGTRIVLRLSAKSEEKQRRVRVCGPSGQGTFDDLAPEKLVLDWSGRREVPVLDSVPPLIHELTHFAAGVAHRRPFTCDATEGRRVVELLRVGERSMRRGGVWLPAASPAEGPARFVPVAHALPIAQGESQP